MGEIKLAFRHRDGRVGAHVFHGGDLVGRDMQLDGFIEGQLEVVDPVAPCCDEVAGCDA